MPLGRPVDNARRVRAPPGTLIRMNDAPPPLVAAATLDRMGLSAADAERAGYQRVRQGIYVLAPPAKLEPAHRLLLSARAISRQRATLPLFSHHTAAAAWGLPIIGRKPQLIEEMTPAGTTGRSPGVKRRRTGRLPRGVLLGDLLVTPPARTVVDLARERSLESALTSADFAVRAGLCTIAELRAEVDELVPGARGRRLAGQVVHLVDAASESVGESLSRARMYQLGIPRPRLQESFVDADGLIGRVDFWWKGFGLIGEFDGALKYKVRDGMSSADGSQVLWREKLREDRLRAGGARAMCRWTWADAFAIHRFEQVLQRAGLPTGDFDSWQ